MRKIETKGNLPKSLAAFAKTMDGGKESTEFYRCSSAKELTTLAKDRKCELATAEEPGRGYLLCGFDVVEEKNPNPVPGKTKFVKMIIYFVDLKSEADFKRYDKMIKKHRKQQEEAMIRRRQRIIDRKEKESKEEK